MNLINQVITAVLDPNLFYSRFAFYESDKRAIDIKQLKAKRAQNKGKFNTRSALIKALVPKPSDGKVRAMFNTASNRRPSRRGLM